MEGPLCANGYIPILQAAKPDLINLCKRIDALEKVVSRANHDLVALETAVDNLVVESWMTNTKFIGLSFFVSSFHKIFNKFSFITFATLQRKNQEFIHKEGSTKCQPAIIYNSNNYFIKRD